MASTKVERLIKATAALEAAMKHHEITSVTGRKGLTFEKERSYCSEIREILVGNDFAVILKEDKRYSEKYTQAMECLFKLANHSDASLRTLAEESLDAALRSLLLAFHHSRLIVLLITEINKNGPARSLVAAYNRLTQVIHLSKANRIVSYAVHIVNALAVMLRRPEDMVQNALLKGVPKLFAILGPKIRDQHVEKAFELYRVAADNLDLPGTTNRTAVVVIAHICQYYSSLLKKAVTRCLVNIRRPDENDGKLRIIGSLNVIKTIWEQAVLEADQLPTDNLKNIIVGVLLCMHSKHSEVVVASLEVLEQIMSFPIADLSFYPPHLPNKFAPDRASMPSESGSPVSGASSATLMSSPLGSMLDLSTAEGPSCNFIQPLELPDRPSSVATISDDGTEQGYIIDPLLHADLFEEQQQEEEEARKAEGTESVSAESPHKTDSVIPMYLPEGFCVEGLNCCTYAALLIGKRFLLSGLKGLKNDREVRISHKLLALNCLSSIANKNPGIGRAVVIWPDCEQCLSDVARFVMHDDDQLCAAAFTFVINCDRLSIRICEPAMTEMFPYCVQRVISAFQPIRKRAFLQATIGATELLEHYDLFDVACRLAVGSVDSTFFLLRTSVAEWISSIKWSHVSKDSRSQWQNHCLNAFLRLLMYSNDPKVEAVVAELLPRLVQNTELGRLTNIFHQPVPDCIVGDSFAQIPVVLGMSDCYSFRNEAVDFTVEENLEIILLNMFKMSTLDNLVSMSGFVSGLSYLVDAYSPSIYQDCWQIVSRNMPGACGFLNTIIDIANTSFTSPQSLVHVFNVISALFAGLTEGQMMRVLQEQMISDRKHLPRPLDAILTDKLLLLPLRVLNMYYSLIGEHKSLIHQSSTGILSRPTIAPIGNAPRHKTASSSRVADISRLLGTSLHPTKASSFLECPSVKGMFSQIKGAHANFLEKISEDQKIRFTELLSAAVNCLGRLLEMLTYPIVRPLLEEILLYLKVVFELDPSGCARLLHQLFKLVFGKNAANINLDTLQQLNMKHPLPPTDLIDMYLVRSINEFTLFSAFVSREEFVDVYVRRHVGWMRADLLSKVHVPPSSEITQSLQLFEGFITNLIHIYQSYNDLSTKEAILGVMCELPRDGVVYTLADPKRCLFEAVLSQIGDMSATHTRILRQVFLYLVVLSRTEFLEWTRVESLLCEVLERTNERNCKDVMAAIDIVACEALVIRKNTDENLYSIWKNKAPYLSQFCPEDVTNIWTLFLHACRRDEHRWLERSLEMWNCYMDILANDRHHSLELVRSCFVTLSCLSPQLFRPIDAFFNTLRDTFTLNRWSCSDRLARCTPLVFLFVSAMTESKVMVRLEQLIDNPLQFLARHLYDILWNATLDLQTPEASHGELIVLYLQVLSFCLRSERLPKLSSALRFHTSIEPSTKLLELATYHPKVLVHWISFLALTPSAVPTFLKVLTSEKCCRHVKYAAILLFTDVIKEESFSEEHLTEMFKNSSDVSIPLSILSISDKKLKDIFLQSLTETPMETFIECAAASAKDTMDMFVGTEVVRVSEEFSKRFNRIPCVDSLTAMVKLMLEIFPSIKGRLETSNLKGLVSLSETGIPLLRQLIQEGSSVAFFRAVLHNPRSSSISSLLPYLVNLPTQNLYYVFENVPAPQQARFLTLCLEAAEYHVIIKTVEPEEQRAAVMRAQEILDTVADFIEHSIPLAFHVYARLRHLLVRTNLSWSSFKPDQNSLLLEYSIRTVRLVSFELLGLYLEGLQFIFTYPPVIEYYRKTPFADLSLIRELCVELALAHEQASRQPFIRSETQRVDIVGVASDSQIQKDLWELFESVQYICEVYRSQSLEKFATNCDSLEKTVQVLLRHPVIHSLAMVPETALRMNWSLRIEVRPNGSLAVPLVNIHLLCNVDILEDFTWRVRWLGWTNRKQFEDFWMSLFGVLSSTPTGTELTQENSSHFMEQILASSRAVAALTDILLQSLLYPEPGNVATSNFIVKHREKTELIYKCKSMRQLSTVKARLTNDKEPSTVYKRNIETCVPDLNSNYGLGQLSALSLWTLTGVLNDENNQTESITSVPQMRVSTSEYLLRMSCELDTASSVRALFENYSHWFSRGLEYLSLPILSATVCSMTLLSDLFDDATSYVFLFTQMKNVFNSRILHSHIDLGYVIYSLLKAVTVVGLDAIEPGTTENDLTKQLLLWIETGLTCSFSSVRESTLHGFLYLLQSMAGDALKPLTQYVSSFLISEVTKQLSITDTVLMNSSSSIGYESLVWATTFRIMEEPIHGPFKSTLNQKLCEALLVVNLPSWLLELITSGIESLVFHSSTYADQFISVVRESFRDYQFHTGKFPFVLRIFLVCIFREEADPTRNSYKKFQPLVEEITSVLKRCDTSDASLISIALPPVLRRIYRDNKALESVLDMLFPSVKLQLPDNSKAMFYMVYEFFERLRDKQRVSMCVQLTTLIIRKLRECRLNTQHLLISTTLLLTAASCEVDIACRFPVFLDLFTTSSHSWSEASQWILRKTAESLQSEGITTSTVPPEGAHLDWLFSILPVNE